MTAPPKMKILFLCTGNSCRSQMAEGWACKLKSDCIEPYSAGIETHGLNLSAVQVMAEAGVDISGQRSKHVDELFGVEFDYVVTVCGHANEHCPVFLGKARIVHVGLTIRPGWRPVPKPKRNDWLLTAVFGMRSRSLCWGCPSLYGSEPLPKEKSSMSKSKTCSSTTCSIITPAVAELIAIGRRSVPTASRVSSITTTRHANWAYPVRTWRRQRSWPTG